MKELLDIPTTQSLALKAAILKELMNQLQIPIEKFDAVALNPPSAEEKKEAALKLGLSMSSIGEMIQKESMLDLKESMPDLVEIQEPRVTSQQFKADPEKTQNLESIDQRVAVFGETRISSSGSSDDHTDNSVSEIQQETELVTNSQIQQVVLPVLIDRLVNYGKPDQDTQNIVYQSGEYTASLELKQDWEAISLDKNSPESDEIQQIISASKDANDHQYTITLNHLTKVEFERFKMLYQELISEHEHQHDTKPSLER